MIGLPLLFKTPGISTRAVLSSKFASRSIGRNTVSQNSVHVDAKTEKRLLKGAHASLEIAHDEPTLVEGYHSAEPGHRWTTGTATIPAQFLACLTGPVTVEVQLAAARLRYARRAGGSAVVIPLSGDRRDVAVAA